MPVFQSQLVASASAVFRHSATQMKQCTKLSFSGDIHNTKCINIIGKIYVNTAVRKILIRKILTRFGQMVQKLPSTDVTQCLDWHHQQIHGSALTKTHTRKHGAGLLLTAQDYGNMNIIYICAYTCHLKAFAHKHQSFHCPLDSPYPSLPKREWVSEQFLNGTSAHYRLFGVTNGG